MFKPTSLAATVELNIVESSSSSKRYSSDDLSYETHENHLLIAPDHDVNNHEQWPTPSATQQQQVPFDLYSNYSPSVGIKTAAALGVMFVLCAVYVTTRDRRQGWLKCSCRDRNAQIPKMEWPEWEDEDADELEDGTIFHHHHHHLEKSVSMKINDGQLGLGGAISRRDEIESNYRQASYEEHFRNGVETSMQRNDNDDLTYQLENSTDLTYVPTSFAIVISNPTHKNSSIVGCS